MIYLSLASNEVVPVTLNSIQGPVIEGLTTNLASKGAPVILGEWGVGSGSAVTYDTDREAYLGFAEYLVKQAGKSGIGTFHWMGISDGADRSVPKFTQPDLKDAIIRAISAE